MRWPVLLLVFAIPAVAQDAGVQRELIQRQQQTDSFNQQLRQSQERIAVPPGDLHGRQRLDARQLSEQQNLETLNAQQLRDTHVPRQPELRPYDRQNAAAQREPFRGPILEVPVRTEPKPNPLAPELKGNIPPLETPNQQ